jgi:hypothetical protein
MRQLAVRHRAPSEVPEVPQVPVLSIVAIGDEAEMSAALGMAWGGVVTGVGAAFGRQPFERPAVEDERVFDVGLVERGVHLLAEGAVADAIPRPVDADSGAIDQDAH